MIADKPLADVVEADILQLILDGAIETKYVEFKEALPEDSDSSKAKFLSNVVSFANTSGGVILFGIAQNGEGIASGIAGIESSNTDQDFQRLMHIVQTGIEPRIPTPEIKEIPVSGKKVYVLKIDQSFNRPHRLKQNQKFYGRNSNGRYELDVEELRNLFLFASSIEEKMDKFRTGRLLKIKSEDFPFKFIEKDKVALHIMPVASLANNIKLDLKLIDAKLNSFFPIESGGHNRLYNFDGRMNYFAAPEKMIASYVQIFRNGVVESVISGFLDIQKRQNIFGKEIERSLREAIAQYLIGLNSIGVDYPVFISISFLNVKGARIISPHQQAMNIFRSVWGDFGGIHGEDLLLGPVYVENAESLTSELDYCFTVFWNTDGFEGIPK